MKFLDARVVVEYIRVTLKYRSRAEMTFDEAIALNDQKYGTFIYDDFELEKILGPRKEYPLH